MNLDDLDLLRSLDRSGMLVQISALPEQLEQAFALGQQLELPVLGDIQQILVVGCGAIMAGADCLNAYAEPYLPIPLIIWRENQLPGWANNQHTFVIVLSFSGDSLEAVALLGEARQKGCQVLFMGGNGQAAELACEQGCAAWVVPGMFWARTMLGIIFGLLYRLLERSGLLPDPGNDLQETLQVMRHAREALLPEVPVTRNPAKRLAGQMLGRWVLFFASDYLAPVARRWKNQLNELAKSGGQFEFIPEADYNTLVGLNHPDSLQRSIFTIFLRGDQLHAQNLQRLDLTREICLQQGLNTDFVNARGVSRLAQMWTTLLFGDFSAFYLAIANGVDPTPETLLDVLQAELDETLNN